MHFLCDSRLRRSTRSWGSGWRPTCLRLSPTLWGSSMEVSPQFIEVFVFSFSLPVSWLCLYICLVFRLCDRCYLQRAGCPEGRWRFPRGRSLPQTRVYWNHQRQGINLWRLQQDQFHHPSLSALSPLPLVIQSIHVMMSFAPFPLFFLGYM